MLPKISWYVKTFNEKNNKLLSLCIKDNDLLEKYETLGRRLKIKKY